MPTTVAYKQTGHLNPELSGPAGKTLRSDNLTGHWLNTNRQTQGIAECLVERDGESFNLSIAAAGADGPISWPRTKAKALANLEEEAGQRAFALTATFDFGFMLAEIYIRVNKGVLVIVIFNSFHDDSGRSNYVNREFFYRRD